MLCVISLGYDLVIYLKPIIVLFYGLGLSRSYLQLSYLGERERPVQSLVLGLEA
jgi:hypothetical protein